MPRLSAPHWNEKDGVCTKHMLPRIPCPLCAMEKNQDVEVRFDEMDLDVATSQHIPLRDLIPGNFVYLADRDGNYMEPDSPAEEAPKDSEDEGSCFMDIPPL